MLYTVHVTVLMRIMSKILLQTYYQMSLFMSCGLRSQSCNFLCVQDNSGASCNESSELSKIIQIFCNYGLKKKTYKLKTFGYSKNYGRAKS